MACVLFDLFRNLIQKSGNCLFLVSSHVFFAFEIILNLIIFCIQNIFLCHGIMICSVKWIWEVFIFTCFWGMKSFEVLLVLGQRSFLSAAAGAA